MTVKELIEMLLNELGASSVNFVVRVWSKSSDLQNVYWDILERIKREFDANGISFPYPVSYTHLQVESAIAWKYGVERQDGPTALILSRQNLAQQERTAAVSYTHLDVYKRQPIRYTPKDCSASFTWS